MFDRALLLLVVMSAVVCVLVWGVSWQRTRRRWRAAHENPDVLLDDICHRPLARMVCGVLGVGLILLVCYELVRMASIDPAYARGRALMIGVLAIAAGAASFVLVGRRWSPNLADVAMGLVSAGVTSLALAVVPSHPADVAARYPMMFNGVMLGLAVMTWFWVWVGRVWSQQLDEGRPWTAAGHLSRMTAGISFVTACVGVVNGWLMAIWPKLRAVAVFDDSLGRVAAGATTYLLLLWAVLWCGRKSERRGFGVVAVLVMLSMAGFVIVRAEPLWAQSHQGL